VHCAGGAGLHANADLFDDKAQVVDAIPGAIAKVVHRQVALEQAIGEIAAPRALGGKAVGALALAHLLGRRAGHLADGVRLHAIDADGAAHGHGLEPFGAHHGAHAGAAMRILELVHHAGVLDHVLAAGPDQRHLNAPVAELGPNALQRLFGGLAPIGGGIADLHLTILDPQIHGRGRYPFDDQGVKAGALELVGKEPARLTDPKAARERRFGPDGRAAGAADGQARQLPGRPHDLVLRPERVGAARDLLQQDVADQVPAAHVAPEEHGTGLFDGDLARRQVHAQDLVVERTCHLYPPKRLTLLAAPSGTVLSVYTDRGPPASDSWPCLRVVRAPREQPVKLVSGVGVCKTGCVERARYRDRARARVRR